MYIPDGGLHLIMWMSSFLQSNLVFGSVVYTLAHVCYILWHEVWVHIENAHRPELLPGLLCERVRGAVVCNCGGQHLKLGGGYTEQRDRWIEVGGRESGREGGGPILTCSNLPVVHIYM